MFVMSIIAWIVVLQSTICISAYAFMVCCTKRFSDQDLWDLIHAGPLVILRPNYLRHASKFFNKNLLAYAAAQTVLYVTDHHIALWFCIANMITTNLFYSYMFDRYTQLSKQ